MSKEGDVILRWKSRHQEIAIRLEAKTKGYIGEGFTPSEGMKEADMVVEWIDDLLKTSDFFSWH